MDLEEAITARGPVGPLLQIGTPVANLRGWVGGIVEQPWYEWLSPTALLVEGGDSTTGKMSHRPDPNAGEDGVLYSLPIQPRAFRGQPMQKQAVPLTKLSRLAEPYGGVQVGLDCLSPDGRWILLSGRRRNKSGEATDPPYWVAATLDGSREVTWPQTFFAKKGTSRRVLGDKILSDAVWLPDSNGILEMESDAGRRNKTVRLSGRVRLLSSPNAVLSLPPVTIEMPRDSNRYEHGYHWLRYVRRISATDRTTLCLRRLNVGHDKDPALERGGSLKHRAPDQAIVYGWNWREGSLATPSVRAETYIMPDGYHVWDESISPDGKYIVWALMNDAHHAVVQTGMTLHRSHGVGKITLWASKRPIPNAGARNATRRAVEIGYLPIPLGEEAYCYQRFGLGGWVPGKRRISFIFEGIVYTVAVPG